MWLRHSLPFQSIGVAVSLNLGYIFFLFGGIFQKPELVAASSLTEVIDSLNANAVVKDVTFVLVANRLAGMAVSPVLLNTEPKSVTD